MWSDKYTVQWLQAGQPRPYADSFYEFNIIIEYSKDGVNFEPRDLLDSLVETFVKTCVHNFYKKEEKPEWHQPILEKVEKLSLGKWHFFIRELYTD